MAKLTITVSNDYDIEGKSTEFKIDNASAEAIRVAIANTGSMETSGAISSTLADAFRNIDNIRAVKPPAEPEVPSDKKAKSK